MEGAPTKLPSIRFLATFWFGDYPGMTGNGYADLRDLPLGGTWIGIIRKPACHINRC